MMTPELLQAIRDRQPKAPYDFRSCEKPEENASHGIGDMKYRKVDTSETWQLTYDVIANNGTFIGVVFRHFNSSVWFALRPGQPQSDVYPWSDLRTMSRAKAAALLV